MMRGEIAIRTDTGSELAVRVDSADGRQYISWIVGSGYMLGTLVNNPKTRQFFKRALVRLERDARSRKGKGQKCLF